jgi:glutathione S-transferase
LHTKLWLSYERALHRPASERWSQRCLSQIHWALDAFEAERGNKPTRFWLGESLGHTDLAVAGAVRSSKEAQPMLFNQERWAALAAYSGLCESLEPFREISPTFSPPS